MEAEREFNSFRYYCTRAHGTLGEDAKAKWFAETCHSFDLQMRWRLLLEPRRSNPQEVCGLEIEQAELFVMIRWSSLAIVECTLPEGVLYATTALYMKGSYMSMSINHDEIGFTDIMPNDTLFFKILNIADHSEGGVSWYHYVYAHDAQFTGALLLYLLPLHCAT